MEETQETLVDQNTSDVSETTEVVEEVTEGVTEDIPSDFNISLEDLINAEFEEDDIMNQEHTGLPHYNEILKHIPENGRKLIANLRSAFTKKTQELAAARKEVEAERAKLQSQTKLLTESSFAKNVAELANDNATHDIWDEEGRRNEIRKQAAIMMQQMLDPLKQEVEQERRRVQLESFKAQNPDLTEYRMDIAKMLLERPELKLEDAYHLVKARAVSMKAEAAAAETAQRRTAQRSALKKTSTGRDVGRAVKPPKFKDGWSAYQWHKANQEGIKD